MRMAVCTGTGKKDEKVIKKKNISLVVFGKSRNHEAVLKYARNMTENYKKRIKTIEKIEQNDIIKTIVRTIGGKL